MSLALKTKTLPALVLLCWLSINSLAQATDAGVHDTAKLFSSETLKKANDTLKDLQQKTKKTVVIDTFRGIPAEKREAFQANRAKFYLDWVTARGKALGISGVYFLICEETAADVATGTKPRNRIEYWADPATNKLFTKEDAEAARDKLGKMMATNINQGLLDMVAFTDSTMEKHFAQRRPPAATPVGNANAPVHNNKEGTDVTMIVIYIIGGLLGFWILIGLVRAFTRPRVQPGDYNAPPPPPGGYRGGMAPPPPPGYGQPYGGQPMGYAPQQQAGGMGFMGSLMTGMLGAAAGNFMYDRFFRGGSHGGDYGGYGGSSASTGGGYFGSGNTTPSGDPGTGYAGGGDYDQAEPSAPAGGGGGDYDQDMTGGGGDFGGGDTGGGGDFGGGSDFGGGGGDFSGGDSGGGGGDY
ncbi:MAG TPA: hypothetical protein PLN21_15525 [Gemmatales bacterium]|nr:hypothetical protein [Gemmatales bacterium]